MTTRPRIADLVTALLAAVLPACSPGADPTAGAARPLVAPVISAQQAKLLAIDGGELDSFGSAVGVSGATAVIGAPRDDDAGTDAGAAYVFVRSATTWTQQAKLLAADGASNDSFGGAIAVSGDTAVVGAVFDDGVASDSGAAYVFVRSGTSWTQQAKLVADDGAPDDQLGISVAISGDTVVVGTTNRSDTGTHSGAAYVFVRTGSTWAQQAKLTAADAAEQDQFGISVAISGNTAVAGAYGDDDNGRSSGSAYVFVRTGTSWTQQAKLLAADGADIDELGISVAVSGDTALAGAVFSGDTGAAYVFTRTGSLWSQQAKLTAADAAGGDNFGNAVSLVGDTALIGAPGDGNLGAASGSAYVFTRSGATWSQDAKLLASDGASVDLFGASVALSGDVAVLGAFGDDDLGNLSGSAYVFGTPVTGAGNGTACTSDASCASGFCTDGVCCNTACGAGATSDCQACSVAAGAAVDGTCAPRAAGIVCRAAAGACDVAETCTGSSLACPTDTMVAAGTVCRASAGACDVAESCTGSSPACPGDGLAAAGAVCRPASGSCDLAESCSGGSSSCPANQHKPDLSLCRGVLGLPGVCLAGTCLL